MRSTTVKLEDVEDNDIVILLPFCLPVRVERLEYYSLGTLVIHYNLPRTLRKKLYALCDIFDWPYHNLSPTFQYRDESMSKLLGYHTFELLRYYDLLQEDDTISSLPKNKISAYSRYLISKSEIREVLETK